MRYRIASLSLALGLLPGVSPRAGDPVVRRSELYMTVQESAQRAAAGDFIGSIAGIIATEGFMVGALRDLGMGPAAARTLLERDTLNARSRASWRVLRVDVSADGNDGYTYGYLDVIRPNGDTLPGAFQAYWRRRRDGKWKALAFGRSRREMGATEPLPDSTRAPAMDYRAWPMRDTSDGWSTLKATESAFAESSATSVRAAFMSFSAPDAAKITGARYAFGRDAIGEGFRNPPAGFAGITWFAQFGTVSGSNDLGFNVGPVTQRNPPAGAPASGSMFFTIWRRQPNGEWKYLVD